jgi:hypothetical protein
LKKAFLIITAVFAYSLVETGLLLSTFVSRQGYYYPNTYQATVCVGQLLLIPGLAALLSRIMYGAYRWRTRTLAILLAGILAVPIGITVLAIVIVPLAWTFDTSRILFDLLLSVSLVGIVFGLFAAKQKSEKWGVRAEAARWLAERQSGIVPRDVKWRNRGIRFATCFPSLLVLLVFLFLPEVWGMLSHLSFANSGNLVGYKVPIPTTWIALRHDSQQADGWSTVTGFAGRGIGRGVAPYLHWEPPFSSWDIETDSYAPSGGASARWRMPSDDEVTGRRSFTIGADSITCLDYWPSYLRTGPYQRTQQFDDLSVAYIECSNGRRLHAGFFGIRGHAATFYEMLGRITPVK